MKIEVLGPGCPNCKKLEENARQAIKEMGIKADIVKVSDIAKIIGYGVLSVPALAIDGEVKCYGRAASISEIKKWL